MNASEAKDNLTQFVCPEGRHKWREIRAKQKDPGPPYKLMLRCRICAAIKTQVISYERMKDGSEIPLMKSYLNVDGFMLELPTRTYLMLRPDHSEEGGEQNGA